MAMAWQVKKWAVTSGGAAVTGQAVTSPGPLTETVTSAFSIPGFDMELFADGIVATRENQLVSVFAVSENLSFRGLRNDGFKGDIDQDVTETTTYDNDAVIPDHQSLSVQSGLVGNGLLFGNDRDLEYVMFNNNLFYPKVQTAFRLNGFFSEIEIEVTSTNSNGTLTVASVVAPSVTFPLRIRMTQIIGARGHVAATTVSGSVGVTMTATEFWPYA